MTENRRGAEPLDLVEDSSDHAPIKLLPEVDMEWHKLFLIDRYDWDDPEWLAKTKRGKHAWRMIPLCMQPPRSRLGHAATMRSPYFAIVSPLDYQRLTHYPGGKRKNPWTLKIDYDPGNPERIVAMYARRCGRGDEVKSIYMHREVLRCENASGVLGDHINGYGLDNRRCNLYQVDVGSSANQHNGRRIRKEGSEDFGLPPGVEHRGKRFGGKLCKRKKSGKKGKDGRRPVMTIRSKLTWATPEPAARWYQNRLKEMHGGRSEWAHCLRPKSFPLFPPLLESEPSKRSTKMRHKRTLETHDAVPF